MYAHKETSIFSEQAQASRDVNNLQDKVAIALDDYEDLLIC